MQCGEKCIDFKLKPIRSFLKRLTCLNKFSHLFNALSGSSCWWNDILRAYFLKFSGFKILCSKILPENWVKISKIYEKLTVCNIRFFHNLSNNDKPKDLKLSHITNLDIIDVSWNFQCFPISLYGISELIILELKNLKFYNFRGLCAIKILYSSYYRFIIANESNVKRQNHCTFRTSDSPKTAICTPIAAR